MSSLWHLAILANDHSRSGIYVVDSATIDCSDLHHGFGARGRGGVV